MAGVSAFREAFMSADTIGYDEFDTWEGRMLRYQILWALFENTAYRSIHSWSSRMKVDYGLYKYIRNIYNPANRLGIFWQSHIFGGSLDLEAGDGQETPSAIPIDTEDEAHRMAISQVWRWSNWASRKDIFTLWGSVLGDVGLRVVDAPEQKKCTLQIVHPGTLVDVEFDVKGNVRGYTIEEWRADPEGSTSAVKYTEVASRDGELVVYETYLNDVPYAWNGNRATWSEPYGFVPLVLVKHNDVGHDWGWAEIYPALSKVREIDDQASKLSDQVRKMVDAPFLFSGVDKPKKDVTATGKAATTDRPEPGREEVPAIYAPAGASATPLVAPLDIGAVGENIERLLAEIENALPELQQELSNESSDASGRAKRLSRQWVDAKIQMRRQNYDDGQKRALQMALSIGGFRGYEGFAGFGLDSYKSGDLEFSIAQRPGLPPDPMEKIEEEQAFWAAAKTATQTGMPLNLYLKRQGWTDAEVAEVVGSPYYAGWVAMTLQSV